MDAEPTRPAESGVVETDAYPPYFDGDTRAIIDVRPLISGEDDDVPTTDVTVPVPSSFMSDDDGGGDSNDCSSSAKEDGVGGMGSYPYCPDTFPRCCSSSSSPVFLSEISGRSGLFFESIKGCPRKGPSSHRDRRGPDHHCVLPRTTTGCQTNLSLPQKNNYLSAGIVSACGRQALTNCLSSTRAWSWISDGSHLNNNSDGYTFRGYPTSMMSRLPTQPTSEPQWQPPLLTGSGPYTGLPPYCSVSTPVSTVTMDSPAAPVIGGGSGRPTDILTLLQSRARTSSTTPRKHSAPSPELKASKFFRQAERQGRKINRQENNSDQEMLKDSMSLLFEREALAISAPTNSLAPAVVLNSTPSHSRRESNRWTSKQTKRC